MCALESHAPNWAVFGGVAHTLVHAGQHYDFDMSEVFFQDLKPPQPDLHLDVGSGTHAEQTALVMPHLDPVLDDPAPTLVIVAGDVNSPLAADLTVAEREVPVAHIAAGLRSGDRTMPEESKRRATDEIGDYSFTSYTEADANLLRQGVAVDPIFIVGTVMIDSLVQC